MTIQVLLMQLRAMLLGIVAIPIMKLTLVRLCLLQLRELLMLPFYELAELLWRMEFLPDIVFPN